MVLSPNLKSFFYGHVKAFKGHLNLNYCRRNITPTFCKEDINTFQFMTWEEFPIGKPTQSYYVRTTKKDSSRKAPVWARTGVHTEVKVSDRIHWGQPGGNNGRQPANRSQINAAEYTFSLSFISVESDIFS